MDEQFSYRTLTSAQAEFLSKYCDANKIEWRIWGSFLEMGLKIEDWAKVNRFLNQIK